MTKRAEQSGTIMQGYRVGPKSTATHPGNSVTYLLGSIFDGTNHTQWLNGTGATPVSSSGNFNWNVILINARWINNNVGVVGNNKFAEILVLNTALTTLIHQKIEGYLANKWGAGFLTLGTSLQK